MTKEEEKYTTLDTEQCKWWVNTLFNMAKEQACNSHNFDDAKEMQSAQDKIIKALEQETVSKEVYDNEHFVRKEAEQKLWELQQNVSDDCVSRQAVLAIAGDSCLDLDSYEDTKIFCDEIKDLPPVTPTHCIAEVKFSKDDLREICNERIEVACEHGTCKDCIYHGINKEHTDIDGARYCSSFRTYTGYDFYCAEFERRGNEND